MGFEVWGLGGCVLGFGLAGLCLGFGISGLAAPPGASHNESGIRTLRRAHTRPGPHNGCREQQTRRVAAMIESVLVVPMALRARTRFGFQI